MGDTVACLGFEKGKLGPECIADGLCLVAVAHAGGEFFGEVVDLGVFDVERHTVEGTTQVSDGTTLRVRIGELDRLSGHGAAGSVRPFGRTREVAFNAVTPRARLVFAPEVRKALTEQVIEEARASIDVYTCVGCGRRGDARTELTSVLVVKPPNFPPVIQFAHNTCVISHVADGVAVDPDNIGGDDVITLKVVFRPGRDGHSIEAMLLVDRPRDVWAVTESGDPAGLDTQLFLGDGFELATAFDQPFPEVVGYTVHLNPDGSGRIDQLPGRPGPFLEHFGDDNPGDLWHATARSTGWLTVLTGNLGIAGAPTERTEALVKKAFATGNVVGGRIRVIRH